MKQPIRILHVVNDMSYDGGIQHMIMNLYRNINTTIIQFDFAIHCESENNFHEEIERLGGKVYRFPKYKGVNHYSYCRKWDNFFENNHHHKIIHGHYHILEAIFLGIAQKHNLITIAHSHVAWIKNKGFKSAVKYMLQYQIRYKADYFFACSLDAGQWLFGQKVCQSNRFYIVKNAIEVEKYIFDMRMRNEQRKALGIKNQFVIGHVGKFLSSKNHSFLIDLFKTVHEKRPETILLLVGGGGNLENLIKRKVKHFALEQAVIFTGAVEDVEKFYQAMDIFVFPSLFEGLGIALIEAQTSSLPCVVSDVIPKEALITDLIQKMSLNESKELWATMITDAANTDRVDMKEQIIQEGYDIKDNAKWLSDFYLTL